MSKKSYDLDDFDYLDDDLAFLLESLSTDEDGEFVFDEEEPRKGNILWIILAVFLIAAATIAALYFFVARPARLRDTDIPLPSVTVSTPASARPAETEEPVPTTIVTVTPTPVPKPLRFPDVYSGTSQDELNRIARELGCDSVFRNSDGMIIVNGNVSREELMQRVKKMMDDIIGPINEWPRHPHFAAAQPNEDYSVITIVIIDVRMSEIERGLIPQLLTLQSLYNGLSGNNVPFVEIDLINMKGDVINRIMSNA